MNIYKIKNKVNNKEYVGLTTKSIQERFQGHKYTAERDEGYYLHNAMRKYGIENFSIEHIDIAKDLKELKEKEIFYIRKFNTFNNGYNLTKGGDFSANNGFVIVEDSKGNILRVSVLEFIERDDLIHINKNKITIFKDNEKKRVSTAEYKLKYFDLGWRSKNYGFTTVKLYDGTITKIPSKDFDKSIHTGISAGTQTYYNSKLDKFESLSKDEVDLDIHYTKDKIKYYVYNHTGDLIEKKLSFNNIDINNGLKQFAYIKSRTPKNQKEWMLTEDIINKLKNKYKDFSFVGYKLVKEQL